MDEFPAQNRASHLQAAAHRQAGDWRNGPFMAPAAGYALLAAGAAAGLALVYLFDPRSAGWYPVCPFFGLTGWHCPGCGTLRALHQLLHGNLAAAFGYNLYSMLALPAVAWGLAAGLLRAWGLPAPPPWFIPSRWIWGLLAAVLAFWLLRNLPVAPLTFLAP